MPTFGSTSAAITLSFDFDIVYSSERIINNSFFSFQCSCVNVCKLMETWIAAHLSHSGCVREGCCPGHMSPATPVCPVGMLWCPRGVRCHPHHALWTGTAGPLTMDKGCAHMGPRGWSSLCLEVDNLCGHLCGPGHVWGHITWRNGPWTSGGAVTLSTKGTTPTCWIFSAASLGCYFPAITNNTAAAPWCSFCHCWEGLSQVGDTKASGYWGGCFPENQLHLSPWSPLKFRMEVPKCFRSEITMVLPTQHGVCSSSSCSSNTSRERGAIRWTTTCLQTTAEKPQSRTSRLLFWVAMPKYIKKRRSFKEYL